METTLFIAGYFVVGFILAVVWCYHNPYEYGMAMGFAVAWPLLLAMLFFALAPATVADMLRERLRRNDQ